MITKLRHHYMLQQPHTKYQGAITAQLCEALAADLRWMIRKMPVNMDPFCRHNWVCTLRYAVLRVEDVRKATQGVIHMAEAHQHKVIDICFSIIKDWTVAYATHFEDPTT